MAPDFNYRAKKPTGEIIKGTLQAESRQIAADIIHKQGLYVVGIEEKKDLDLKQILKFFGRIKTKDLAILSRQFAVLIQAGVPIIQCLSILIEQIDNKNLKTVMQEIYQDVEIGSSFSEALEKHEDTFPPLYSRMVNAGEVGGILDVVMDRLADHYERENELKTKVRSALIYPVVVLMLALAIVTFMMIAVVPVFADLFRSMGGVLPLPTRIVMGVSKGFTTYWYLILIFGFALVAAVSGYLKTPQGQFKFHQFQLKLPIFGSLFIKIEVTRLTRTLGSLMKSGVPLMDSLRVVERIIGNQVVADKLTEARMRVREGVRLSEPLKESGVFPKVMTQMLVVGEETGTMDEMLEKISQFYDRESQTALAAAMSLLEPALIILVALLVGVIVVSIILPMFDMVNLV